MPSGLKILGGGLLAAVNIIIGQHGTGADGLRIKRIALDQKDSDITAQQTARDWMKAEVIPSDAAEFHSDEALQEQLVLLKALEELNQPQQSRKNLSAKSKETLEKLEKKLEELKTSRDKSHFVNELRKLCEIDVILIHLELKNTSTGKAYNRWDMRRHLDTIANNPRTSIAEKLKEFLIQHIFGDFLTFAHAESKKVTQEGARELVREFFSRKNNSRFRQQVVKLVRT